MNITKSPLKAIHELGRRANNLKSKDRHEAIAILKEIATAKHITAPRRNLAASYIMKGK